MSWEAISGLIGATIGALASYFGSMKATQRMLDGERAKRDDEHQGQIKASARAVFIDLVTGLRKVCRTAGEYERPMVGIMAENITIAPNHLDHLTALCGTLTSDETILLDGLYALLEKARQDVLETNFAKENSNRCRRTAFLTISEVFGSIETADLKILCGEDVPFEALLARMRSEYSTPLRKIRELL